MPSLDNDQISINPFLTVKGTKATPSPFENLTEYLPFADETQKTWWLDSGSLLARMLSAAQYTTNEQYQHLLFFHRHLIPFFGPKPIQWPSLISGSGLPIEYSLNFQANSSPVVRIAFEPVGCEAGTPADPFNKKPLGEFVAGALKHGIKGLETGLLNHFTDTLFLPDNVVEQVAGVTVNLPRTHAALGFDLNGDRPIIKGYVHLGWRSRATGIPVSTLIKHSINSIQSKLNCQEAFDLVNQYMDESSLYNLQTFLAWDCTPMHASRLKIYGIHSEVSMQKIEDIWTMGGRLADTATLEELGHLQRLWKLLDINDGIPQSSHYDDSGKSEEAGDVVERRLPLFWNYEITAGSSRVAPKIYLPVYGENDLKVARALSTFFEILGWDDKADQHIDLVRGLYPDLDISKTSRLQSLISFAYSREKGVYMSVYYHSTSSYPV